MAIKIGANLAYNGKLPNFERDSFETKAAMKAFDENSIDEGHLSYCKEDGNIYQYKSANSTDATTGRWRIFKTDIIVDDNLNGTSTNAIQNKTVFEALKLKADSVALGAYQPKYKADYIAKADFNYSDLPASTNVVDLNGYTMSINKNVTISDKNFYNGNIELLGDGVAINDSNFFRVDFNEATYYIPCNNVLCELCNLYKIKFTGGIYLYYCVIAYMTIESATNVDIQCTEIIHTSIGSNITISPAKTKIYYSNIQRKKINNGVITNGEVIEAGFESNINSPTIPGNAPSCEAVKGALQLKADKTQLNDLATKTELNSKADASALDNYVTTTTANSTYAKKSDITSVYKFKGNKTNYADLPTTDRVTGDVWNITNANAEYGIKAGDNVAWNGTAWDNLSGTVDLSGYATTSAIDAKLANLPDEEDITYTKNENGMDVLSLKNRTYNPLSFLGKGYRVLRKNIQPVSVAVVEIVVSSAPTVDGYIGFTINGIETRVDVATTDNTTELVAKKIGTKLTETMGEYSVTQSSSSVILTRRFGGTVSKSSFSSNSTSVACSITDSIKEETRNILISTMISAPNTIYEIRYDFDLNGETIEIPNNCTLRFTGGKLANGTLKGSYSNIEADNVGIFEETLSLAGNFNGKGVLEYYEEKGFWDTAFKNILLTFAYVELASMKSYTFSGNIIDTRAKKRRFRIEGNHAKVLNLTFLYNIDKNGTNVAETSAIGMQLPSILNINFSRNDGKALPAIISGSALSIENCTFNGFTYCIAFLPIYIDTFVIDKGQTWACDYLLTSMNANGELTDSYFIGDWFSIKNFAVGGKGFTSFPITRGDFLFENCLHVILSLGYSGTYTLPSFSATFIRCHFESKSPMITYKKTDWNVGGRITFIGCWFYSSSLSDYPSQYHINSTINVGNSSNTNKVDLGTIIGTYCIQYKSAGFIVNDSSLVNRDTTNLLPIQALDFINMDTRALFIANENIFHVGDTVKIGIGYSSSPNALILNNQTSQLFQKDFTCTKDGLITVTIWPKSRSFYLHCFYTFEGKTYRSVVPISDYASNGKANNSTFDIRLSKDKCLGSFFHEYSGELKYEVDTSGIIKGGTSSRPTLTSDNAGYEYYDIDLGKKILWNGTAWVNLDGTALA